MPGVSENDSATYQFRFIADLDCCAHEALALGREFDLVSTWNSLVLDSTVLAQRGWLDMRVYSGVRLPWPLAPRQAWVAVRGCDCLEADGSLMVLMESFAPAKVRPTLLA